MTQRTEELHSQPGYLHEYFTC